MNPFTRFLKQWTSNKSLEKFVTHWDTVEMVTIRVYREKMNLAEARPIFDQSWLWLRENYSHWADDLRPYWQKTKTAGEPTQQDPFQMLIDKKSPSEILGDWSAIQHLPAAREALNQYIRQLGK